MNRSSSLLYLSLAVALLAITATSTAIFSDEGPGAYTYTTIRGQQVQIYGKGLYRDMSAELAPQGLAQDYVTLFIAVPVLLLALVSFRKGSVRSGILLAGSFGYFLVTYLFYLAMGMYNMLFLVYAALLCCSFFGFWTALRALNPATLPQRFSGRTPLRRAGITLLLIAGCIGLLWLSIVLPPLFDGSIVPKQTEHYTTLVVQGFDLGLLLPIACVTGVAMVQHRRTGFVLGPVYLVFLSLLMLALCFKLVAMGILGYTIVPAIYIIPAFLLLTAWNAGSLLLHVKD